MGRRQKSDSDWGCAIVLAILIVVFLLTKMGGLFTGLFGGADATTNLIVGIVAILAIVLLVYLYRRQKRAQALKLYHERLVRARREEEKRARTLGLADVDNMKGLEFERYVGRLLSHQGFQVEITKASADLGVDIIAEQNGIKYAIQAKRHAKNISRRAVSDAVAGKGPYNCNMAMVITNSYFTDGAKKLANSTGCELIDRDILANWILDFQRVEADEPAGETGVPLETKKAEEEAERPTRPRLWPWFAILSVFVCIIAVPVLIKMLPAPKEQRRQASAPTSVTTSIKKPTRTKLTSTNEPSRRATSVAAGSNQATSAPKPTPTSTQKPTTSPTPITYVVKAGDTLSAIAKEFGITVEALQEINAISDPKRLQVGQELMIPQGKVVARATTTSVPPSPTATAQLLTLTSTPVVYVVKAGDTLGAIAEEFGVTVEALQEVNAISDPKRLQIGQELIIPKGETIAPRGTASEVKPTSTPASTVTNTPTATKTTTVTPTPTSKPTATPSPTPTVLECLQSF